MVAVVVTVEARHYNCLMIDSGGGGDGGGGGGGGGKTLQLPADR